MFESKFSLNEKRAIIEEFAKRTCTSAKFAKNYNVTPATLYKWRQNLSSKDSFIPLQIDFKNQILAKISASVALCKNDLSIKFENGCNVSELKAVLELIGASK